MKIFTTLALSLFVMSQANATCPTQDCPNLEGTIKNCKITSVQSDRARTERKTTEVVQSGINSGALDIPVTQETIANVAHGTAINLYKDPYNEYITNNQFYENESGEFTKSWCQGGILYTNIYNSNNEGSLSSETSYRVDASDQKVYIQFRGDLIGGGRTATVNLKCDID